MIRKLVLILVVMLVGSVAIFAATQDMENVSVLVTPTGDVIISLDQATVDFDVLDVYTSSNSPTAITITNDGEVGCKLSKGITTDAGQWDITASSTTEDGYDLLIGTATSQPSIAEFEAGNSVLEITSVGAASSSLTGVGAGSTQVTLSPTETCKTWFMIRMPKTVSVLGNQAQTITVTYQADPND